MVRLRFSRIGRHHRPFFRLHAVDSRARRDGRFIEQLGWYDPLAKDESKQVNLNEERVRYWIKAGAQPSDTVRDLLARRGLIETKGWEAQRAVERQRVEQRKAEAAAGAEKAAEGQPAAQ